MNRAGLLEFGTSLRGQIGVIPEHNAGQHGRTLRISFLAEFVDPVSQGAPHGCGGAAPRIAAVIRQDFNQLGRFDSAQQVYPAASQEADSVAGTGVLEVAWDVAVGPGAHAVTPLKDCSPDLWNLRRGHSQLYLADGLDP